MRVPSVPNGVAVDVSRETLPTDRLQTFPSPPSRPARLPSDSVPGAASPPRLPPKTRPRDLAAQVRQETGQPGRHDGAGPERQARTSLVLRCGDRLRNRPAQPGRARRPENARSLKDAVDQARRKECGNERGGRPGAFHGKHRPRRCMARPRTTGNSPERHERAPRGNPAPSHCAPGLRTALRTVVDGAPDSRRTSKVSRGTRRSRGATSLAGRGEGDGRFL